MKSLGSIVRLAREANDMTATELAEKVGCDKSYVSLIESDTRKCSAATLNKIAIATGVPLDMLVYASIGERSIGELARIFDEFERLEKKLKDYLKRNRK